MARVPKWAAVLLLLVKGDLHERPFVWQGLSKNIQTQMRQDVCYNIDRRHMIFSSRPVVEMGMWAAIAKQIDRVKHIYYTFVSDHGTQRTFPDRPIIMRLAGAIGHCNAVSEASDMEARTATSLMNAMALVHPLKYLLVRQSKWDTVERIVKRSELRTSGGDFLRRFSQMNERYRTATELDPRGPPRRWGTQTSVEALKEDLEALDRVNPFDSDFAVLFKIFMPASDTKGESYASSREWGPNESQLYYRVLKLIAQCLGEQTI